MNNYTPPSTPQRSRGLITTFFVISFLILSCSSFYLFWFKEFGQLDRHAEFIFSAIKELIFYHSSVTIEQYWIALSEGQIRAKLLSYATLVIVLSAFLSFIAIRLLFFRHAGRTQDIKVKGGKLRLRTPDKTIQKGASHLFIHPELPLDSHQYTGNLFTFGAHGSGKSTLIKFLVSQLIGQRGKSVILFDEKREYTQIFYKPDSVHLIAPWDARTCIWDIGSDLKSIPQFRQFVSQLIPIDESKPTWGQGAQDIMIALMLCCQKESSLSWKALSHWLSMPVDDWLDSFEKYYPPALKFITGADETVSSYISNLSSNIAWIHDLALLENSSNKKISFNEWIKGDRSKFNTVIIQSHPFHTEMMAKLASAILHCVSLEVLSSEDNESEELWLILDELGNLPKLESLQKWLSTGRSKGARTIAGTQNISQTKEVYGENISETLLSLFKNHVVFQCGAIGKTPELASDSLGQVVFERPSKSSSSNGDSTFTWHKFTENLVPKVDIINLKNTKFGVVGFAKVSGDSDVYKLEWGYNQYAQIAPSTVISDGSEHEQTKSNRLKVKRTG
ncbi:type IV secretion system DNA-binding domain-containing protein [Paraglaciecola hydrolytica]|uniref:Type IV secretion system coupling protein TraD DNA-binding domain-containing protein n=1 Tax=Paraglaciecola hydrolytica TaxID=1799789 RepID=A0A148KKF2_9ALTE|nr:type IV secretion system DNA-binding domain-containing protein [Paraglaciecola hydrolytica]KXI26783.1 hypothetical protein AX660_03165 [Paraglaciecola hydrolytica]